MRFLAYYKRTRTSHGSYLNTSESLKTKHWCRYYIEAPNAPEAFKIAVKELASQSIDIEKLKAFYVTPVKPNTSIPYTLQAHGFDERGDFPRGYWKKIKEDKSL